jgi:hypothetical protein
MQKKDTPQVSHQFCFEDPQFVPDGPMVFDTAEGYPPNWYIKLARYSRVAPLSTRKMLWSYRILSIFFSSTRRACPKGGFDPNTGRA